MCINKGTSVNIVALPHNSELITLKIDLNKNRNDKKMPQNAVPVYRLFKSNEGLRNMAMLEVKGFLSSRCQCIELFRSQLPVSTCKGLFKGVSYQMIPMGITSPTRG